MLITKITNNTPVTNNPEPASWFSRKTLQKVAAVALCIILVMGAIIPPVYATCSCKAVHDSFTPYTSASFASDPRPVAIPTFSPHIVHTVHNGYIASIQSDIHCVNAGTMSVQTCDSIAKSVKNEIKKQKLHEVLYSQKPEDKGVLVSLQINDEKQSLALNMDPKKLTNHRNCLAYLEKTVLQNPDFFTDSSPDEIVEAIKESHRFIMSGSTDPDNIPGQFRALQAVVIEDGNEFSVDSLRRLLKKHKATKKELEIFDQSITKMEKYGPIKGYEEFTYEEQAVWRIFAHIPTAPECIEQDMLDFAEELKEVGIKLEAGKVSCIDAAAWAHQQIGWIHPFSDGNGRVARAWMNSLLQRGGVKAVVFPDDTRYTKAVRKDQLHPGLFRKFLQAEIKTAQ